MMEHGTQSEPTHDDRAPAPEKSMSTAHTPQTRRRLLLDTIRFVLIALVIVVPIRLFIAQPFIVQGASMHPTFETGQYLIVDQLSYQFTSPKRGEIVIFRHPLTPATFLIKRIVGLPGETVEFRDGVVVIVNDAHPDGFIIDEPYVNTEEAVQYDPATISLGPDEYAVLGDNRGASADSRIWGSLDKKFIIGKALVRLLPVSEASVHPGAYRE